MNPTPLKHYFLDTHTAVISEPLTEREKLDLGIDPHLCAHFNEIGFAEPANSEAWKEDCFNVIISADAEFDDVEVMLLPIAKLPGRLEQTYNAIVEKRLNNQTQTND